MAYSSPALNVMVAAARKAGRPLIRDFNELENLQISMKGPADFVTSADKRTEKILIEELSRARPEDPSGVPPTARCFRCSGPPPSCNRTFRPGFTNDAPSYRIGAASFLEGR